ncbi:hypothetical protein ACFCWB_20200 [Streptomyces bacillaris]|uniref:DUF6895 family protein n=1 Tax=Streptomyces bacillaris TaxID=68179 RepID=UPI0035D8F416
MSSPLDQLSAGALDWLGGNLDRFDPYAPHSAGSPPHLRAKAVMELALLCHCAARLPDPSGDRLEGARALLRRLWQREDFPRLFEAHPGAVPSYPLAFAALAPAGTDDTVARGVLARLAPADLAPSGKPPLKRLEIRYYADKAGVRHGIEPYPDLATLSPLATLPAAAPPPTPAPLAAVPADTGPLTNAEGYSLTHTAFYLGDYGRTELPLTDGQLARAGDLVHRMLDHCVGQERWDLAAELVITQFILGLEPLDTPSGTAAVECLVRAQRPDGALPGRSAALRAPDSAPAGEFFRKAYHTTLVTALMGLVVLSGRPAWHRV